MTERLDGGAAELAARRRTLLTRFMGALGVGIDVALDRPGQRSSRRLHVIGTGLAGFSGVIGGAVLVGYVARQEQQVERQQRLAEKTIPASFDYARLTQLRIEARQKLTQMFCASSPD